MNITETRMTMSMLAGLTAKERRLVTKALGQEEDSWMQKTEGKWTSNQWLKFRGIGIKTIKKLEKLNLSWDPPNQGHCQLSVQASNILWALGLKEDLEVIKKAVESGTLRPGKSRNMGNKTYAEIRRWAGMEPAPPPERKWKFDPYTGERLSPDNATGGHRPPLPGG